MHDALRNRLRRAVCRKSSLGAASLDSQTVKTTEAGGDRGYDAGKKINGRKRHVVVDTLGLILAAVVHSAGLKDYDGARLASSRLGESFGCLKLTWVDAAYGRNGLPKWVASTFGWMVQLDSSNDPATRRDKRLRGIAQAMSRRTRLRLDRPPSTPRQRLRTHNRIERSHDLHQHDSTNVKTTNTKKRLIHKRHL